MVDFAFYEGIVVSVFENRFVGKFDGNISRGYVFRYLGFHSASHHAGFAGSVGFFASMARSAYVRVLYMTFDEMLIDFVFYDCAVGEPDCYVVPVFVFDNGCDETAVLHL